jgi:hypothetical protein
MATDFPEGQSATLTFQSESPRLFTLALRRPSWAGDGFQVQINGDSVAELPKAGTYVTLKRTWKAGDVVALTLPKTLRLEPLPDNPRRVALFWGPLVLAGDLGAESNRRAPRGQIEAPVFVAAGQPVTEWLKPVLDQPGRFKTEGVGQDREVEFLPFYRLHRRTYAIYWDLFTPAEWTQRAAELAAEQKRLRRLELATVAFVQPGEMQPERDANQQGEDTSPDRVLGRPARRGKNWFSFDLAVDPAHPMALVVTYCSDEWRKRTFDVLTDSHRVGQQTIEKGGPPRFFDVEYALPAELVRNKTNVTVRFQATGSNEIAAVFGIRMIRADAAR